ncbi:hypothetical protein [Lewinella sp. IMCC34183]|uniref:hypothetical protein n=1 Tax=Lewinella sp. IMCC34183 TaxID=2248762 RepID=UPI000E222302|nr:hypothetical protein [Lewinella sp. IMCC34183]
MIFDNGKRGINLTSDGTPANHIGAARIRFNTIVSHDRSPVAVDDRLRGLAAAWLGNVAIRTDGGTNYVYTTLPYAAAGNVIGGGDIGFVDFAGRDLRITASSAATGAATGIEDFPTVDFEGDPRDGQQLDAGADELE